MLEDLTGGCARDPLQALILTISTGSGMSLFDNGWSISMFIYKEHKSSHISIDVLMMITRRWRLSCIRNTLCFMLSLGNRPSMA